MTAFVRVLGAHGQSGATIAAVAAAAGVAPGLVHHHFSGKQELYSALLDTLVRQFRERTAARRSGDPLEDYGDAALALDSRADQTAARAWVSLFSEGLSDPMLFDRLRRAFDNEIAHVQHRARGTLSTADAGAVVAFVIGALVFGAFAPRKTAGFAAPALRRLLTALRDSERPSR